MVMVKEIMKEKIGNNPVNIAIVHAQDVKIGKRLLSMVEEAYNHRDIIISELFIGIAANLGPGTVGIIACPAQEISLRSKSLNKLGGVS